MAGIAIAAILFLCIFVYCNCIRKTAQKDKIYASMDEARLEDDVVIVEEKEAEDESDDEDEN